MKSRAIGLFVFAVLILVNLTLRAYGLDAAFIIGVGGYTNYTREKQLPWCSSDAKAFAKTLLQAESPSLTPETCIALAGPEASAAGISKALLRLKDAVTHNGVPATIDRLFFYYSGHCARSPLHQCICLMPFDANPNANGYGERVDFFLDNLVKTFKPKKLLVFIDSCHAAAAGQDQTTQRFRSELSAYEAKLSTQLMGIFASDVIQEASGRGPSGHSWLTETVIRGLQGDADLNFDQEITASELWAHIEAEKNAFNGAHPQDPQQPVRSQKFDAIAAKWSLGNVASRFRVRYVTKPLEDQAASLAPIGEISDFPVGSGDSVFAVWPGNKTVFFSKWSTNSDSFSPIQGELLARSWQSDRNVSVALGSKGRILHPEMTSLPIQLRPHAKGILVSTESYRSGTKPTREILTAGLKGFEANSYETAKWQIDLGRAGTTPTLLDVSANGKFIINFRQTQGANPWPEDFLVSGDANTGKISWTNRYTAGLTAAAIASDGSRIACAFRDNTILFLSPTGKRQDLIETDGEIKQVGFLATNKLCFLKAKTLCYFYKNKIHNLATVNWSGFLVNSGKIWGFDQTRKPALLQNIDPDNGLRCEIILSEDAEYVSDPNGLLCLSPVAGIKRLGTNRRIQIFDYP